jgi:hypothetical protein
LSFVSGKAHLSLSSQWPNIIRRSTLRSVWECVFAWCLRPRSLVFEGKDLCNLPPPTKNSPYFGPVFLHHALLHAHASNLFYALLRNLSFKLQVYGNYHWDWGPWSHQVAKVRLAIPQGPSNLNPIETLTDVCVALCCTLDVTAKILLHWCVQRKGLHNTWKLEAGHPVSWEIPQNVLKVDAVCVVVQVGWDESTAGERQQRVSIWDIEPLPAPFLLCPPPLPLRSKRTRGSRGKVHESGNLFWNDNVFGAQLSSQGCWLNCISARWRGGHWIMA